MTTTHRLFCVWGASLWALVAAGELGCGPAKAAGSDLPVFTAEQKAVLATLSPAALPPPPPDISNRFANDANAAALGQRFFFDPGFSGQLLDSDDTGFSGTLGAVGQTGRVACAGCHVPAAGFVDNRSPGRQISLAAAWGRRKARSLLDVGQAKLLMWDGRHDALYNQPFTPLETLSEMNTSRLFVAEQIFLRYKADYEAIFGTMPPLNDATRFPQLDAMHTGCQQEPVPDAGAPPCHGVPGDQAEFDGMALADQDAVTQVVVNMGKALGAYERLLTCGPSRFDAWMHGQADALTPSEQRGAAVFIGKGACTTCHSGPYLSDQQFHNVGLAPAKVALFWVDANDRGAAEGIPLMLADPLNVQGKYSDGDDGRLAAATGPQAGAFRTPSLRCVGTRPSFLHTGQYRALPDVIAFFDRGGDPAGYYAGTSEVSALGLTATEASDLVAFLEALDGPGPAAQLLTSPP